MKKFLIALGLLFYCAASYSEADADIAVTILPTNDSSGLGLGEPLQYALGQLLQETGALKVQLSGYTIPGFTRDEVVQAFNVVQSDLISFIYMEKERISTFLFLKDHPKQFIVAYRGFADSPDGQITSDLIEMKLRETVNEVLASYNAGNFQPLPASDSSNVALGDEEHRQRADEARILFRELTSLEEKKWYVGANVGMARYSETRLATPVANSTVNFGVMGGRKINERFSVEAGLDIFTFAYLHSDVRYRLPFLEKYADISLSGGLGTVLTSVTENKNATSTNTSIAGSFLLGPGVGFDVPLLGAVVRGEVRYYIGSTSILVGAYGVVVAL